MKLLIYGSRGIQNRDTVFQAIDHYIVENGLPDAIITGDATGVDALARLYAHEHKIDLSVFPADWEKYGRKAGYVRNNDMVNACDRAIGIWDGKSPGALITMRLLDESKSPSTVIVITDNSSKTLEDYEDIYDDYAREQVWVITNGIK